MFDVFTSATGTTGTYPTLDKAVVAAKKLGRTAQIFNTNNPFKVVKTVCGDVFKSFGTVIQVPEPFSKMHQTKPPSQQHREELQ